MSPTTSILSQLKQVHPTEFEHLVFDLVQLLGLRNVSWRTPGPDGGRDIEGELVRCDFSGVVTREKWYVECKRYENALNWPQVFEKIAYATNHRADFLLVCTTASLSPSCKNELTTWQSAHPKIKVRAWEGAELENRVAGQPLLLEKYGLAARAHQREHALMPLVLMSHKAMQAEYGRQCFLGEPARGAEYAAGLAELIHSRLGIEVGC